MEDRPIDKQLWDDDRFVIKKWDEMTKYKLEGLRRQAEMKWGREVTIQEVAEMAIDYAYKGLSLQIIEDQ